MEDGGVVTSLSSGGGKGHAQNLPPGELGFIWTLELSQFVSLLA